MKLNLLIKKKMHTLYNLSQENKVIYAYVSKYIKGLSERAKTGCRQAKEKKNKQTKKKKKSKQKPKPFLAQMSFLRRLHTLIIAHTLGNHCWNTYFS